MVPNDLAIYAAGFFDGEGYVGIRRSNNNESLNTVIGVTNQGALQRFKDRWGGTLRLQSRAKLGNCKDVWIWSLTGGLAAQFLTDVYPWLVIKKPVAKLGRTFYAFKTRGPDSCLKGFRGYNNPVPVAVLDLRNKINAAMRACNKRGRPTEVLAA